jgi:MerR family redox-sensitive transcriptional activator SoxR
MQIGELARQTGIAASALRYYEDLGLLPAPSRKSGRRDYTDAALDRIAFIQFARACGFRLDEIAVLLGNGRDKVSARWRKLATAKMAELDALIANAQGMKQYLGEVMACNCIAADECGRLLRASAR